MRTVRAVLLTALAVAVVGSLCPAALARAQVLRVFSPQAYQLIQRGADDSGVIVVTGRSRDLGPRVQARWGEGQWVTAVVRTDGSFTVNLRGCPTGQATLQVRAVSHDDVVVSVPFVGVGDIFVIAGQSNASGRGSQPTTASHPFLQATMFGNDDHWKPLTDPVDSPVGQVDRVSIDPDAAGSVWPLVATDLMAADDVPVAFVPCAKGTTSILKWQDDPAAVPRDTLYGSMIRRVHAVGGRVRAVVFWQGEADARAGMSKDDYLTGLRHFAATVARDCRAPLVVAQIGDYDHRYTAEGVNAVRLAQQDAWRAGWVVPGPALYDIDLHGRVHFTRLSDLMVAARRWAAAILGGVEHASVSSGPWLESARYDGDVTVTLRFLCRGAVLRSGIVGGLGLSCDGQPVTLHSASVTSADTVKLVLEKPASGELMVSLGDGRDAAGQPVPTVDDLWASPARIFLGVPAVAPAS